MFHIKSGRKSVQKILAVAEMAVAAMDEEEKEVMG